jgi:hypothetical protein
MKYKIFKGSSRKIIEKAEAWAIANSLAKWEWAFEVHGSGVCVVLYWQA